MEQGKYGKEYFDTLIVLHHKPTEMKFYQQGGRVIVTKLNETTGIYHSFADFTTTDLQEFRTRLTEAGLRRAAIAWMKDNIK